MKKIAYVVENEVFCIDEAYHMEDRERFESSILSENLVVVESTDYPSLSVDSFYENGLFYAPSDINKTNPLPKEEPIYPEARYFAHILDGVVFRIHVYSFNFPPLIPSIAAYKSNPKFYDVTGIENVDVGWIWNGSTFTPPLG